MLFWRDWAFKWKHVVVVVHFLWDGIKETILYRILTSLYNIQIPERDQGVEFMGCSIYFFFFCKTNFEESALAELRDAICP